MPVRRGYLAPPNTYIETVIRKFDGFPGRNFVIGNALSENTPIIYCNASFCELTGYERHELVQRSCRCDFLHGPATDACTRETLDRALHASDELHLETYYYRKDGEKFLCSVIVAPIKNEHGNVILYIVNHEEVHGKELVANGLHDPRLPQRKISSILKHTFMKRKSDAYKKSLDASEVELEHLAVQHSECLINEVCDDDSYGLSEICIDEKMAYPPQEASILIMKKSKSLRDVPSIITDLPNVSQNDAGNLSPRQDMIVHSVSEGHINKFPKSAIDLCYKNDVTAQTNLTLANVKQTSSLVPNGKTQKVAQVMSLGSDVLPEYKVESPKIHPWTILHYSPFKAIWDWIVLFLVMYTAIVTPYMAAFVLTRESESDTPIAIADDPLVIVDYIVDVMFIIDIFINFRTTFVDTNDEVVSDPCRVAVHYMKAWFVVDLLAAIPFELLIMIGKTGQTTTLIGLLKTARLLRLVRVARKLDRYSEYGTALLMLLMFGFALVAHWLACVWYAIGNFERPGDKKGLSWLTQLGIATGTPYTNVTNSGPETETKYLTALYFTLSSLTSVGFGNVSANTTGEKIFTILIMFLGALMHAVIFGNVTAIIQRLYSGMAHYHSTMRRVREFIRFYQIPSPLRQRLEDYAQYDYSYTNGIDMNEVLRNFPEGLQADICLHLNRQLLSKNPAFRGSTPGCLRSLSLKLSTTHCPPGDYIIHHGDEILNLYWIGRGTVEIIQNETIIAILGKGDSFGENFGLTRSGISGKARASVRALTYCDLHVISRDSLLYIMKSYPEFRRTFNEEMQITYDLRDLEVDDKDVYTSMQSVLQRPTTRSFTNDCETPRSVRYQQTNSIRDECEFYQTRTRCDSTHSHHQRQSPKLKRHHHIVRQNDSNSNSNLTNSRLPNCNCSELKNDLEELKKQLTRLECSMKDDVKLILSLLRGKQIRSEDRTSIQPNNSSLQLSSTDTSV